jgi:hypothetical protein
MRFVMFWRQCRSELLLSRRSCIEGDGRVAQRLAHARGDFGDRERLALASPAAFEALCRQARRIQWVVFVKPPFGGPEQVLKYLARYTHGVAISNRRLLSMEDGRVTFEYKDYADGHQIKVMTLAATEFIRRFLLHILPSGFVRIRQFGFLANRARGRRLALCRALLGAAAVPEKAAVASHGGNVQEQDRKRCPACKIGHLVLVRLVPVAFPHTPSPRLDSS